MIKITNELIEQLLNENESSTLDFKGSQYRFIKANDVEKSELLKDILAFVNGFRRTDAFILIGVKEVKGSRAEVVGIVDTLDDASLQQFVNSKTQRPVEFLFETFSFEGKKICIIQIPIQERPRYLLQDFGELKKEKVFIRRGTSTGEASPDEIAKMSIAMSNAKAYEPILKLRFGNGSDQTNFELTRFENFTTEDAKRALEDFKTKYPKEIHISGTSSIDAIPSIGSILAQTVYGDPKIREEYFKYLDDCFKEYEEYLDKRMNYENQNSGRVKLSLELTNTGTLPADDIDILLHFPDGFLLYSDKDLIKEPKEPKPLSFVEHCNPLGSLLKFPRVDSYLGRVGTNIASEIRNVSSPKIRRSRSYDVQVHVRRLKHNQEERLDPLYAVFNNYETVESFTIEYKIQAANVPEEINGKLEVKITKK
jgi:hypothetical protein